MAPRPPAQELPHLPAALFQRGVHDCPSCRLELSSSAPTCPRCQCNLGDLHNFFQSDGPQLDTIMDFAKILQGNEGDIRKRISLSERKFPQLNLMFCSLECPEGSTPATTGWWMLNHGQHFSTPSWSGLLIVDPTSHLLSFQVGYDLEVFVSRQKLESLLSEVGDWFAIGEWAGGTANFFKELHAMLRDAHREALKTQKMALRAS